VAIQSSLGSYHLMLFSPLPAPAHQGLPPVPLRKLGRWTFFFVLLTCRSLARMRIHNPPTSDFFFLLSSDFSPPFRGPLARGIFDFDQPSPRSVSLGAPSFARLTEVFSLKVPGVFPFSISLCRYHPAQGEASHILLQDPCVSFSGGLV